MKDWVNTFYERTQAARSLGCALIHDLAPVNDEHDVDGEQRFQCKAHNCDFRAVQTTKDRLKCYDWVNHRL